MPLDTEFYMPETGRHDFSLSFPPVDPKTAKIDLIESDCPDCFKIYDIDLTGKKAKPGRSALAKKYKKTVPLTENFTAPIVSDSPARIAGTITGYDPRFFDRIEIAFYSPIVGDGATELKVPVHADGSFETGLNILTPIRGMLFLPGSSPFRSMPSPGGRPRWRSIWEQYTVKHRYSRNCIRRPPLSHTTENSAA